MLVSMLLATILIFLGLLLVLVLVHEWGHFIVAKKAGCTVEEFGFGFPPRVFGRMWHGTLYSLNLLPLGGFVKIQGEDMDDPNPSATSSASKSAPWRIAILCAGVAMNMLLAIERAGQHITLDITARANPPEGQGALGISLGETGLHTTVWWKAPWEGAKRTWEMKIGITSQFAGLIQKLFQKESVGQVLTGPIGIAIYTREAASLGISYFLEFAAMISINLAIINILPLPALDGGRVLFVIIEKAIGRRVPGKVESYAHTTGFLLLIGLMIAITFKDIARSF